MFGSDRHTYNVDLPISEELVTIFESTYHVTLPRDYVSFVTHIGNGGAGPEVGLFSVIDPKNGGLVRRPTVVVPDLSKPFLLNHSGCGNFTLLVVRGPEAGSVWYDCRNSYGGLIPSFHPDDRTKRLTFVQWYQQWLEESIDQVKKID